MGPKQNNDEILKAIGDVKKDTGEIKLRLTDIEAAVKNNSTKVDEHELKLSKLSDALNDREQHSRNSSIRIFGMKVDPDTARDAISTAKAVYDDVLKVILDAAVEAGDLRVVPRWFELIEHCHCLKDIKNEGKPPIIVRFQSRLIRYLIFKFKKSVLTNADNDLSHISIVEDLTTMNYKKLKELRSKDVVAWSLSGRIFYKDKDGLKKSL